MYKLSSQARSARTTWRGTLRIEPSRLVARFGPPLRGSGDNKVSGTYVFEDAEGGIVTLCDWKSTTLYDGHPSAGLPCIQMFWSAVTPVEFSVASHGKIDIRAFARWLGPQDMRLEGGEWLTP